MIVPGRLFKSVVSIVIFLGWASFAAATPQWFDAYKRVVFTADHIAETRPYDPEHPGAGQGVDLEDWNYVALELYYVPGSLDAPSFLRLRYNEMDANQFITEVDSGFHQITMMDGHKFDAAMEDANQAVQRNKSFGHFVKQDISTPYSPARSMIAYAGRQSSNRTVRTSHIALSIPYYAFDYSKDEFDSQLYIQNYEFVPTFTAKTKFMGRLFLGTAVTQDLDSVDRTVLFDLLTLNSKCGRALANGKPAIRN